MSDEHDTTELEELFENTLMWGHESTFDYRGYTLTKPEPLTAVSSDYHGEYHVLNREGRDIEMFSMDAMGFEKAKRKLDRIIDYDPDDMQDWFDHTA